VLNNNTAYCSIIFANRIESTKFVKFIYKVGPKLNVKTSSLRLQPDSCQTQQHKTDRLTPDKGTVRQTPP
jgi:hypothetical protein